MLKMEYDSIYEQIAKGAIIRSIATWYEKGEKSNKYFLNLETHKKAKSSVRKVFIDEGVLITDPKKILPEIQNFYSNLCKRDPLRPSEDMFNSFLNNSETPKLINNEARICEGKLTVDECYKSLQLFENNKSPGCGGGFPNKIKLRQRARTANFQLTIRALHDNRTRWGISRNTCFVSRLRGTKSYSGRVR